MVATFSHVGMTVNTVPWSNEHIRDSTKRVHSHRWGDTVALNALERSLRKTEPFLQREIRQMVVAMVRMLCGERVVDGKIVDWPPFNKVATEAWQTNTSRYRIPMNHVLGNMVHPMHVRRHGTENDAFVVTKIRNKSCVHVSRKHIGHNFAYCVAAEVLEHACSVFKCALRKSGAELSWRGTVAR